MKDPEKLEDACNALIDWTLEQSAVMCDGHSKPAILDMLNSLRNLVDGSLDDE